MRKQCIRLAQSCATDTIQAAAEFHAAVSQPDMELVIFFCSSQYDLVIMSEELKRLFVGVQMVGCTTAGEIGPAGYCSQSISGASFPKTSFTAATGLLNNLSQFDAGRARDLTHSLLQQLEINTPEKSTANCFAFMMIDGLSTREEVVAHSFQYSLGSIQLFGGSAGDDLKLNKSQVYFNGSFLTDAAILTVINTPLPFKIFKTQHFVPTSERLVITEATPDRRIVQEINGLPAAAEYSRLIGVEEKELSAAHFADSPLVVRIDDSDYVRAIQKANSDGSLTFYCAIEDGIVMRTAHGVDLVNNLHQALNEIREEIGPIQLVLGCDCVHRKLEIFQKNLNTQVAEIFQRNNTIGFNSYGEQFHGIHVNQTLTGCAIGISRDSDEGDY